MKLGSHFVTYLFVLLGFSACVDTSIPTISMDLIEGQTPGPMCAGSVLSEFPPGELRIHIIDVGQGDGIWIQTPYYENEFLESRNIVIDAGSSGEVKDSSPGGKIMVDYMLANGMEAGRPLDGLVVTHAHEDHYGGVPELLENFDVIRYVDPGFDADSNGFRRVQNLARQQVLSFENGHFASPAIPELVPRLMSESTLFGEYVKTTVLWGQSVPPSGKVNNPSGSDINNTSVAFALLYGNRQVLLTGDLEDDVERQLIRAHDEGEISLSSAILKVAHHGSAGSSSPEFLKRVFPYSSDQNYAVISSGVKSFSGTTLPRESTLTQLRAVLTDYHLLSTQNADEGKKVGEEHGDDHILIRITEEGNVNVCYTL